MEDHVSEETQAYRGRPTHHSVSSDLPDGFRMVEVEHGRWIGLPTFDINEWFDSCEIPSEERAGILERGGGYDGFQVLGGPGTRNLQVALGARATGGIGPNATLVGRDNGRGETTLRKEAPHG